MFSEALAVALQHHQAGRLPAAEQIYRQILAADPNHPEALHLLGVLARQVGQPATAAELIQRAIAVKGNAAEFHHNLANVYREMGRPEEAAVSYRRALALNPNPGRLSELRATLRERMQSSPLMNARLFARNIEAAYREIWERWCSNSD